MARNNNNLSPTLPFKSGKSCINNGSIINLYPKYIALIVPIAPKTHNNVFHSLYHGLGSIFIFNDGFLVYNSLNEKSGKSLFEVDGGLNPHNLPFLGVSPGILGTTL